MTEMEKYNDYFKRFTDKGMERTIIINCLYDYSGEGFLQILSHFLEGTGYREEYRGFCFPDEFDPWDEEYFENGIMFYWGNGDDTVEVIDYSTFYSYLEIACKEWTILHHKEEEINSYLKNIKEKYCIK